jgi:hypothetical protein
MQWLKDNIFDDEFMAWYTISSIALATHMDFRQYCYNYIIETGGDDVLTYGHMSENNTEWVKFEPRRWLKLNNHVPHGTVGSFLNGPRILLQITPKETYNHLVESESPFST